MRRSFPWSMKSLMGPRTPGDATRAMADWAAPPFAALAPSPPAASPAPPAVARPVPVPEYASPQPHAGLSVVARRVRLAAKMLLLAAALTFVASLLLPALEYRDGWARKDQTLPGWFCLFFGVPFYPSHLFLLLSRVVLGFASKRPPRSLVRPCAAFAACLSAAFVVSTRLWPELGFESGIRGFYAGFYLWAASHCLVALAFCILCAEPDIPYTSRPSRGA